MQIARHPDHAPTARVLCLTDDAELRARLVQLVGEAGGRAVVREPERGGRDWAAADLVLLDPGAARTVADLPRRPGVVLVAVAPGGAAPPDSAWRVAVDVGAEHVVVLPDGGEWLRARVGQAGASGARLVAVVGARGGAGATAAAVALATTAAAAGSSVLLVDGDELGGGIDLALGAEELPGLRWPDLVDVSAPLPPGGLATALPAADGVVVLSHARGGADGQAATTQATTAVLAAARAEHDLVVVDCGRSPGPMARQALGRCHLVVCVTPVEVRACAAAALVLAGLATRAPVRLLLRGPAPGGLSAQDAEAAVLASLSPLRTPVHGVDHVRAEPGLAAALDRGEPFAVSSRSPLRRWAGRVLADLADLADGPGAVLRGDRG